MPVFDVRLNNNNNEKKKMSLKLAVYREGWQNTNFYSDTSFENSRPRNERVLLWYYVVLICNEQHREHCTSRRGVGSIINIIRRAITYIKNKNVCKMVDIFVGTVFGTPRIRTGTYWIIRENDIIWPSYKFQ